MNGRVGPLSPDMSMPNCLPGNGWLPHQTDLDEPSDQNIQDVAKTLSLSPRKCLGFRSTAEAFLNKLRKPLTIRFQNRAARRS